MKQTGNSKIAVHILKFQTMALLCYITITQFPAKSVIATKRFLGRTLIVDFILINT